MPLPLGFEARGLPRQVRKMRHATGQCFEARRQPKGYEFI